MIYHLKYLLYESNSTVQLINLNLSDSVYSNSLGCKVWKYSAYWCDLIIIDVPEGIFSITVTVPEACIIISFPFMIATISVLIKLFSDCSGC